MTELTEIDGVGPSYAETLKEHGYDTAEEVADAQSGAIDSLFDRADGVDIVEHAQAVTGESADGVEDDVDSESTTDSAKDTVYELEPGFEDEQVYHFVKALVEQEIRARQTNDMRRIEEIDDAIESVMDGEPYEFTLNQLSIAYTAVNQMESSYRGMRGMASFVGGIRAMRDYFQSKRKEVWPDE